MKMHVALITFMLVATVLSAAAPAWAEGEYIMWSKVIDTAGGDIMWDASNTFPSNLTCQEAAEKASAAFEELAKTWPDKIKQLLGRGNKIQNVRRIGTTVLLEVDGKLISAGYTCLPATIDPRKKK